MSASQVDRVREVAAAAVAGAGLVVEDVAVSQAGRRRVVRVVVDLPDDAIGGVGMDAVADASRLLSEALDADGTLGETPYVLEVTSPGVGRPLTERRHWRRARTRLVRLRTRDGEGSGRVVDGRLTEAGDDGVVLVTADGATASFGWDQVAGGEVQVEFGRVDTGADAGEDEDEDEGAEEG